MFFGCASVVLWLCFVLCLCVGGLCFVFLVVVWLLSGSGLAVLCVGCALVVICVVCGLCFALVVLCFVLCFAFCLCVGCSLVVLCALFVRWWCFVLCVDRGLVVIWLRFRCAMRWLHFALLRLRVALVVL
jgi:hypothetical protein